MVTRTPFSGKTAIVTGASSGIGRALAVALGRAGSNVVLAARSVEALEDAAHQIAAAGGRALSIPTDVSQPDQVERLVQRTLDTWDRIDLLIANAGLYVRGPVNTLAVQDFERSMAVNFYGVLYPILSVLPVMQQQRSGHIVLMSTLDAKKGMPTDGPYVAAKSAAAGFCEVLRQELHGSGVEVTIVYPGRVDTPMIEGMKVHPISAKIAPESVARATLRGIRRRRAEVVVPAFRGWSMILADALFPRLADWVVRLFHLEGWT